jgi:hypothetical protein
MIVTRRSLRQRRYLSVLVLVVVLEVRRGSAVARIKSKTNLRKFLKEQMRVV